MSVNIKFYLPLSCPRVLTSAFPSLINLQLVQHIPEASLNYQKVPPGSTSPIDQDSNMNDHDSSRRRPWNREEVKFGQILCSLH